MCIALLFNKLCHFMFMGQTIYNSGILGPNLSTKLVNCTSTPAGRLYIMITLRPKTIMMTWKASLVVSVIEISACADAE